MAMADESAGVTNKEQFVGNNAKGRISKWVLQENKHAKFSKKRTFLILLCAHVVICSRWVDQNVEDHEDFITLHPLPNTKSNKIVEVILNTLKTMGLNIKKCKRPIS